MKNIFIISVMLVLCSCASHNHIPKKGKLTDRIMSLYTAEKNGDWDKWYFLMNPMLKPQNGEKQNGTPFEQTRNFELVSYEIITIKKAETGGGKWENIPAVAVSMDVVVNRNGKNEKENDQTDYWVFIDGEWYWTWRGWPHD